MNEKTLSQHLGTATSYSLTSAGFAGFIVYLLGKYFEVSFDAHELVFVIPTLTYLINMVIVVYKKKFEPRFQEWLKK